MMNITKTMCDHCGKEVFPMKDYTDVDLTCLLNKSAKVDLCKECYDFLIGYISTYVKKGEK